MKFRQSNGNNSSIADDTPIKRHMQNLTMVVYIQYKFHELQSIGYLVIAEGRKAEGETGRTDNAIPITLCLRRGIKNQDI